METVITATKSELIEAFQKYNKAFLTNPEDYDHYDLISIISVMSEALLIDELKNYK